MKTIVKGRGLRDRARRGRIAGAAAALMLVALFAAACDDSTGPASLSSLSVAPTTETVAVGQTVQFTATGTRAGVDVTDIVDEEWSVTGGGTITSSGLFTAGATPGTSTITVTCGGISTDATVIVTAGPLATIVVTPDPATLAIGATQQFAAVGQDAGGNTVEIDPTWSVAAGGGSIDAETGIFTAGNTAGTYENTVTATEGTISGTATVIVTAGPLATITVTPNPATVAINQVQQFTAVGRDAGGNVVALQPTWSVTAGGGINAATGLFTAGTTTGTFTNAVTASQGTISGSATVIVTAGPVATITVTPDPATVQTGGQRAFTAVGRDSDGNIVPISPVWSTTVPQGTINSSTGVLTAGNTTGTFNDAVTATDGAISGSATVTVTAPAPPPPPPGSTFAILANSTVTCTEGVITGEIGTFLSTPGVIIVTSCPNSGLEEGTPDAVAAYNAFLDTYDDLEALACDVVLTGTLAGVTLAPGVYCFDAAATLTGLLTLNGPANGVWVIKAGTLTPGSISGTNFDVVMAGGGNRCNVTWWSQGAATMVDSDLLGNVLAAEDITLTRGTFGGNAWTMGDFTVTETAVTGCAP